MAPLSSVVRWEVVGGVASVIGALVAVLALVLLSLQFADVRRIRRQRAEPPFCKFCGISSHAPAEETRQKCPRNPTGMGHVYDMHVGSD
jgi:hypothetical protein